MKTLIIYHSKTGFTKKYAEWLSEASGCTLLPFDNAKKADFAPYDTVVFASSFQAGTIRKLNAFKNLKLNGKNKIVIVTGCTPPGSPEVDAAVQNNFKTDAGAYKVFYLPGGLSYERMGAAGKLMMSAFCKMIKKSAGEDSEMYSRISHSYDNTSKEYLQPVLNYLNSL